MKTTSFHAPQEGTASDRLIDPPNWIVRDVLAIHKLSNTADSETFIASPRKPYPLFDGTHDVEITVPSVHGERPQEEAVMVVLRGAGPLLVADAVLGSESVAVEPRFSESLSETERAGAMMRVILVLAGLDLIQPALIEG